MTKDAEQLFEFDDDITEKTPASRKNSWRKFEPLFLNDDDTSSEATQPTHAGNQQKENEASRSAPIDVPSQLLNSPDSSPENSPVNNEQKLERIKGFFKNHSQHSGLHMKSGHHLEDDNDYELPSNLTIK